MTPVWWGWCGCKVQAMINHGEPAAVCDNCGGVYVEIGSAVTMTFAHAERVAAYLKGKN